MMTDTETYVDEEMVDLVDALHDSIMDGTSEYDEIPEDWEGNSDVAYALMQLAAEIAIREELELPQLGGGLSLFMTWAKRAYELVAAQRSS